MLPLLTSNLPIRSPAVLTMISKILLTYYSGVDSNTDVVFHSASPYSRFPPNKILSKPLDDRDQLIILDIPQVPIKHVVG
jgi:hypothetical protein